MIYPDNFEYKIGFDRIRAKLLDGCMCEAGRKMVEQMKFQTDFEFLKTEIEITAEMKTILVFEENFPQDNYIDASSVLDKIRVEGTYPTTEELIQIKKSLETIKQLKSYLKRDGFYEKYPLLHQKAGDVETHASILAEIERLVDKFGKIKDNASPELKEVRDKIKSNQHKVNQKLQRIIKSARQSGFTDEDAEVTFRNGRPVIPVTASAKRQLGGIIHDESATGKTSFVEPAEIVELNNSIKELEYVERREVIKILVEFASNIRPDIPALFLSYEFLGQIDFLRAKARFAISVNGNKPIIENQQVLNWRNAVHPLLYLSHKAQKLEVVPLTAELTREKHILVISGPNAGGKSVCLKTVGLLQYMLQCGLLIPLGENSETGVFQHIFIDIGDEQSIDNDLSTYSSHLTNMKFFAKNANNKTLFLIDEFGTGTEPALGGAIAEAILDDLCEKRAFGVVTTHYANLKHYASEKEGVLNGAMMFDTAKIEPLYKLTIGKPGSSFAIDIARKIGLPENILNKAQGITGVDQVNFDKHLREIIRDKKYWETKRQRIRKVEKSLDELYSKY
ncbi:MAG: endonuclease MutS2, partial [Bacteroidales bacterium]|nr:endonuclease MutS2 [Bacteroidales bacterium]